MQKKLDLGNISISWLCGGDFELDGGTMYGAVPKLLWNKKYPADSENYIKLLNAPLLVQTEDTNIVIDTGLGNKLNDKQKQIYRVYRDWSVIEDLQNVGLERTDIDCVILTHCDFDHAGGIVMSGKNNEHELTFPTARHIIQEMEWFDVTHPNKRSVHTYLSENFKGLKESLLLELVEGDKEIVPGVTVRLTGGHTRGHQAVELCGSESCAVHLGDLLPTHTHVNPLWIMAYDNFPLQVIKQKEILLERYCTRNCWFTYYHDIYMNGCRFDKQGNVVETFIAESG